MAVNAVRASWREKVVTETNKNSKLQPSRKELIERAAALVPVLRERSIKTEELRRIPDENIADLKDAG